MRVCRECEWLLLFFLRDKSFLKILLSGEYEKMLVSRNMRLDFHVSNFNSFEFWVFFQFCLITQRYLALCDKLLLLQTNNGCKGDLGFEKGAAVVMC